MAKRQSIVRVSRRERFTITPNAIAQNKELSHAAKGLILQMLSYPDDWAFTLQHLASNSASGLHSTRSAFKELETAGYVNRDIQRDDRGRVMGYEYTVFDSPTGVRFSDDGESHATKTELTKTKNLKPKTLVVCENRTPVEHRPAQALSAPPTSATINQEIQAIIQEWNTHRGSLPAITVLSETRKRKLRSLIREHNGEALALIRDATIQVAANPYWQENRYTLDNLLAGGKYLAHAEAYRSTQTAPRKRQTTEVPF
jgi:hypothetical protein